MNGANIVVFLGPSLPAKQAKALLPDATFLPPARQGDLYRAVRDHRPTTVGLIDGVFATVPAVWHREILWAMADARVRVFGAASMGALRAAELDVFGMVGVGKIYASYCSGRYAPFYDPFEDDDEVAVCHGPFETGCVPVSDAMVDLRETLSVAAKIGIVSTGSRDMLVKELKRLHFSERSLARLIAEAEARLFAEGTALAAWLRKGHAVSQKQHDAEALLRQLSIDVQPSSPASFAFERTQMWERFRKQADAADGVSLPLAMAE
jgi:hypothetical protein